MIHVYDKKEKSFDKNGLAVLNEAVECKIIEKLNNEYELILSYPLHSKKAQYLQPFNVIKADGQLFRIYNTDKDSNTGLVTVYARHIFYDLLNYIIEDRRAENKTCKEALDIILEEIGLSEVYTAESDLTEVATQYFVKKNGVEAVFLLVNEWQGELVRDNYTIGIMKSKGTDRGVHIRYGKNIIGISEKLNCDNVATWIYPVGMDGITLPEKYLLNPLWEGSDYPDFALVKMVEFKEANSEGLLRIEAQKYLDSHAIPDVNYKVDFILLGQTEEYRNYKALEHVEVGDIVTVKHSILGIDIKVKVISIEKDILSAKNTRVELGQPLSTLEQYFAEISRNSEILASTISQALSSMLYFTNPSTLIIGTAEKEVIYMPIGTVRNTNIMSYLILSVNASSVCTLTIKYSLDNSIIPVNLKQKLQIGDNLIAIPMALVAIPEGGHYFSVKLSLDTGSITIMSNGLQLAIDGRNLTGGLSSEIPHAEVREELKYSDVSSNRVTFNYIVQSKVPIPAACTEMLIYTDVSEDRTTEAVDIILTQEV
jgi:phage minor structural protein